MYNSSFSDSDRSNSAVWRKRARNRGVILSPEGWQKLTPVIHDRFGNRYTYEELSERSHLDVRTVSRILSCQVKVDKRTLKIFFEAFNLHLDFNDCIKPEFNRTSQAVSPEQCLNSIASIDVNLSSAELVEFCQRLKQDLRRISNLLDEIAASREYSPNNSVSGIFHAHTDNPVRQFQSDQVLTAILQAS
ncbi:helix-turn-helix transcriptional regulator [Nostoc sp. TCL26-01]|uniref:helix-turn-helix domain-containing protein n=1 Tax=Nostoc sp. TCL26-01 TaxID=2576904 RepID=UPI0015C183CC|nr:helix-turn-helix transcriptional regulator [Nostoc sp. TCL26-01]QLE57954.1 helix-turn-helix transcriptional regulator [Nostoc sp. TCL26-01]